MNKVSDVSSTPDLLRYWIIRLSLLAGLIASVLLIVRYGDSAIEPTSIALEFIDVHTLVGIVLAIVHLGLMLVVNLETRHVRPAVGLGVSLALSGLLFASGVYLFFHAELDSAAMQIHGLQLPSADTTVRLHLGRVLSIVLVLVSIILALFRARTKALNLVADSCIHIVGVLSITYLIAFLFDRKEFSGAYSLGILSPSLGLSLFFLSASLFAMNRSAGFSEVFFSRFGGGRTVRLLIPLSIAITIALSWLFVQVTVHWNVSALFVLVLFNGVMISTLAIIVRLVGRQLDMTDKGREESDWALRKLNDELERRVEIRTKEISSIQEQLRVIVDYSNEALALVDDQGIVRFVNSAALDVGGYDAEDRLNKPRADIVYEDDKENVRSAMEQARSNLYRAVRIDHRLVAKDGGIRWVAGTMTAFRDSNSKVSIVANFHDVSYEKEIERQYRQQLDMLGRMEKTAHIGAWSLQGADGHFQWSNEMYAICEIQSGIALELTKVLDFIAPEARETLQKAILTCRQIGRPFDYEIPLIGARGTEKQVRILGQGVSSGGACFDVYGTIQDVTEKTLIENKLARSMNEVHDYKVALDESSIVAITDRKGIIIHVNENFCKISGYSAQELLGKDHRVLNSSYHPKEFFREMWRTIAHGQVWHGEIRNRTKTGDLYWVDTTIVPFLDEFGKPYEYLAIRVDITERKKGEERIRQYMLELERSNQELEQFAYIASHDLQEPLRMVGSYMDLLRRRYGPALDKDAREFVDFAVDGATRMKQLVNDLLQYSRINRASEPTAVNCALVVERVLRTFRARIEECAAEIVVDELPIVQADETQMGQLFQNLIANALKFRKEGVAPRIIIKAEPIDASWRFSITDNGIGIEKKFADKVFVIFRQLHDKSRYEGTGIGLAVAKRIVERYHGQIWFESVYGIGTTFYFTVPGAK